MADTVLYNHETRQYERVPVEDVKDALASGKYTSPGTVTTKGAGDAVVRPQEDLPIAVQQGEREDKAGTAERAAAAEANRRENLLSDPVLSFAESAVDTLSVGILHDRSEQADIRRSQDTGAVVLGALVGTAVGLGTPGPIRGIARGGEKAGEALARALVTNKGGTAAKIASRALGEAGTNAALMGATAFGHQLSDAIIEDKPFAAEVIGADAGLGTLLGFGAGLLSGGFSAAVSRGAIKGQGGLVGGGESAATALDRLSTARLAWDQAVETHAQRVGVLKVLEQEGAWSGSAMAERQAALSRARKAGEALAKFDPAKAMDGSAKEYAGFRRAMEDYQDAVKSLDDLMRPGVDEVNEYMARRYQPVRPGEARGKPNSFAEGVHPDQFKVDAAMTPERRAAYEAIYGTPYKDAERVMDDILGPAEKGVVSETSEAGTLAGKRAARRAPEPAPAGTRPGFEGAPEPVGTGKPVLSEVDRPGPFTRQGHAPGQEPYRAPGLPSAGFGLDDLTGRAEPVRQLNQRWGEAPDLLGGASQPVDQVLMSDGRILPTRSVEESAADFMRFRDRVLADTRPPLPEGVLLDEAGRPYEVNSFGNKDLDTRPIPGTPTRPHAYVPSDEALGVRMPGARGGDHLVPVEGPATRPGGAADTLVDDAIPAEMREIRSPADTVADPNVPKGSPRPQEPNVRQYIDEWFQSINGRRVSPGDEAAAKLKEALDELRDLSGGRLDSVASLELGENLGLPPARSALGERLDQLWAIRKAGQWAADSARGAATPLAKTQRNYVMDWIKRRVGGKLGSAVVGGVIGHKLGGEAGFIAGAALASRMGGFGARAASAAGRVYQRAMSVGDALLRGPRATVAARALAGNRPYAYTEDGPIHDPVQRIQALHEVAANPDRVRAVARQQMGDLVVMHPDLARELEETAVRQVQALSLKAPALYFNPLGQPITPSAGKLRQFFEAENATHNLDGLLDAVSRGSATDVQLDMLRLQFPSVHAKIVQRVLGNHDALKKLPTTALKNMERVLGVPLTSSSADPSSVARGQSSWAASAPKPQMNQAPGKAQAFKLRDNTPATRPTPAQSAGYGRAPGNEE